MLQVKETFASLNKIYQTDVGLLNCHIRDSTDENRVFLQGTFDATKAQNPFFSPAARQRFLNKFAVRKFLNNFLLHNRFDNYYFAATPCHGSRSNVSVAVWQ